MVFSFEAIPAWSASEWNYARARARAQTQTLYDVYNTLSFNFNYWYIWIVQLIAWLFFFFFYKMSHFHDMSDCGIKYWIGKEEESLYYSLSLVVRCGDIRELLHFCSRRKFFTVLLSLRYSSHVLLSFHFIVQVIKVKHRIRIFYSSIHRASLTVLL